MSMNASNRFIMSINASDLKKCRCQKEIQSQGFEPPNSNLAVQATNHYTMSPCPKMVFNVYPLRYV